MPAEPFTEAVAPFLCLKACGVAHIRALMAGAMQQLWCALDMAWIENLIQVSTRHLYDLKHEII